MKNTLLKLIPVATAVIGLSFSYGAFATTSGGGGGSGSGSDDTQTESTTTTNTDTTTLSNTKTFNDTLSTNISVNGTLNNIDSQATALVNSTGEIEGTAVSEGNAYHNSTVQDSMNSLTGFAQGNVGSANAYNQDNEVAFAVDSSGKAASLDAEEFNAQKIEASSYSVPSAGGGNQDPATQANADNALNSLVGMGQLNVDSGSLANQSNALSISFGSGVSTTATASSNQELEGDSISAADSCLSSSSSLTNSMNNLTGMGQVNVNSGIGVNQHNSIAMASTALDTGKGK